MRFFHLFFVSTTNEFQIQIVKEKEFQNHNIILYQPSSLTIPILAHPWNNGL